MCYQRRRVLCVVFRSPAPEEELLEPAGEGVGQKATKDNTLKKSKNTNKNPKKHKKKHQKKVEKKSWNSFLRLAIMTI